MKTKEMERLLLKANPTAARDSETIKEARKAIKERRKAGYTGKGYDLAPTFGGKRLATTEARKLPTQEAKLILTDKHKGLFKRA